MIIYNIINNIIYYIYINDFNTSNIIISNYIIFKYIIISNIINDVLLYY